MNRSASVQEVQHASQSDFLTDNGINTASQYILWKQKRRNWGMK